MNRLYAFFCTDNNSKRDHKLPRSRFVGKSNPKKSLARGMLELIQTLSLLWIGCEAGQSSGANHRDGDGEHE